MAGVVNTPLPQEFCIRYSFGGRNGYAYFKSNTIQEDDITITVIKGNKHNERYFRVIDSIEYMSQHNTAWTITRTRKAGGRINRNARWRNTGVALLNANIYYPVLQFSSPSSDIPTVHRTEFIPLVDNTPAPAPAPAPVAPVAPVIIKHAITTIPQHAIRALLSDAAMHEEVCPITGDEIDITNGALTSCFHIFNKNAIATWIAMPNSRDKCPVCNAKCNVYNLDEPPPLVISG